MEGTEATGQDHTEERRNGEKRNLKDFRLLRPFRNSSQRSAGGGPVHQAQLLTEMKVANKPVGLLLNFKVPVMKDGITRMLNKGALEDQ